MNGIEALPVSQIEIGLSESDIRDFWRMWRASGGIIDDHLKAALSRLTICGTSTTDETSPPFVFIGQNAFVTRCFGHQWAKDTLGRGGTPDDQLERITAAGYAAATAGDASFDLVGVTTTDATGAGIEILYERLILPLRTTTGHRFLGCMTAPIKPIERVSEPDSADPFANSKAASHRDECLPALVASQSRRVACESSPDR